LRALKGYSFPAYTSRKIGHVIELARVRRFVGLSQASVAVAVGIPLSRLSAFERGRCKLNPAELAVLRNFLKVRLQMAFEADAENSSPGRGMLELMERGRY